VALSPHRRGMDGPCLQYGLRFMGYLAASKMNHEGEFRSEMPHDRPNRPAVCCGRRRGASYTVRAFSRLLPVVERSAPSVPTSARISPPAAGLQQLSCTGVLAAPRPVPIDCGGPGASVYLARAAGESRSGITCAPRPCSGAPRCDSTPCAAATALIACCSLVPQMTARARPALTV
jgi:hypothetical protein